MISFSILKVSEIILYDIHTLLVTTFFIKLHPLCMYDKKPYVRTLIIVLVMLNFTLRYIVRRYMLCYCMCFIYA